MCGVKKLIKYFYLLCALLFFSGGMAWGQTVIYTDDFTTTTNPWSSGGTLSKWTQTTGFTGYWYTAGNYNRNENSYIISPSISMPDVVVTSLNLVFNGTLTVYNNADHGYIDISDDNFSTYTRLANYNTNQTFTNTTIAIPTLFLNKNIKIRITMDDDNVWNTYADGWRVDDVTINYMSPPLPTITSISPTQGPLSGTYTLTINGSNYRTGATVTIGGLSATVTNRTTNQIQCTAFPITGATIGAKIVTVTNTDATTDSYNYFNYYDHPTIVSVDSYTGLTATGVTLHSTVNANNDATTVTFRYGTASGGPYPNSATGTPVPTGTSNTAVSGALSGLTPGTPYYYIVEATNAGGTVTSSPEGTFTTPYAAPTISVIIPAKGPFSGGTPITISGTNFRAGATVTIGSAAATDILVNSSSEITCVTPAGTIGARSVVVTNTDAQFATSTFNYYNQPTIVSVDAHTGLTSNGVTLHSTINANNDATTVTFKYGTSAGVYTTGSVTGTPGPTGTTNTAVSGVLSGLTPATDYYYIVEAINEGGTVTSVEGTFTTLYPVPTITGIVPGRGMSTGGTPITISGTNFRAGATVTIGGTSVTATVTPPNQITCTTPAGTIGTRSVVVTNTDAQFATGNFDYYNQPTIVSVDAVSPIGNTSATLNAHVNPNNDATTVTFNYGLNTSYGSTVSAPENPVNGLVSTAVTGLLTGLVQGTTYHYQVVATNAGGTTTSTDHTFTTTTNPITVTAPNGGEYLNIGGSYTITWTTTTQWAYERMDIHYSTDGGATYPNTITTNAYNSSGGYGGSYNWNNIPNNPSTTVKIRVRRHSSTSTNDASDANFTIGPLTLLSPSNGTNCVNINQTLVLDWTGENDDYELQVDDEQNFYYPRTITDDPTGNSPSQYSISAGTLQANIPYYWRVRIGSSSWSSTFSFNTVSVTAPTAYAASARTCSSFVANWSNVSGESGYRLDVATDNLFANILPAYNNLPIPDEITSQNVTGLSPSTNYYYRVRAVTSGGCTSVNSGTIPANTTAPDIQLTVPSAIGLSYNVGSSLNIQWTTSCIIPGENVLIEYSTTGSGVGANWSTITTTTNTGSFPWTIPNTPSTNCYVRVTSSSVNDISNNAFTIINPATITVTSPDVGNNWALGSSQNITWTSSGIANGTRMRIEYSINGGANWTTINDNVSNGTDAGTYPWTVTGPPSTNCLIRVSQYTNPVIQGESGTFIISGIQVTYPNNGETFGVGDNITITWSSAGLGATCTNVRIEYSSDGGSSWSSVITSTPNDGSHSWTVPSAVTTQGRVRVTCISGSPSDVSDGNFTISAGNITVTSPNTNVSWEGGSTHNITWNHTGGDANVFIDYSTNGGSSWLTITTSAPNNGTYSWRVPSTVSTECRVRVTSTPAYPSVTDMSDVNFTITSPVNVITPAAGNEWDPGSSHSVSWLGWGWGSIIKIEYSTDNGNSWSLVADNVFNLVIGGIQTWDPIPNTPSTQCIVKVSLHDNPDAYGLSGVFTITGLATPNLTTSNIGASFTAYENNMGTRGNPINYSTSWMIYGDYLNVANITITNSGGGVGVPRDVVFYLLSQSDASAAAYSGKTAAGTISISSPPIGTPLLLSNTNVEIQAPATYSAGVPRTAGAYYLCWVVDPGGLGAPNNYAYFTTPVYLTEYLFYLDGVMPPLGKINVLPDKPIEIPFNIEKLNGTQIKEFSGIVLYDSSVLSINKNISEYGTLAQDWTIDINPVKAGVASIKAKGDEPITKDGTLFKLKFDVLGSAGSVSQLSLIDFKINSNCLIVQPGTVTVTNNITAVTDLRAIPTEYTLQQNYPNPFNPTTTITYTLANNAFVTLKVYDALGREVRTIDRGNRNSGYHDVVFDAKNLTSGVYYYVLNISAKDNSKLLTRKMILIK